MSPSATPGIQSKHSSCGFASFCRKGSFAARVKRWPLPGELDCTATGAIPVMGGEHNDSGLESPALLKRLQDAANLPDSNHPKAKTGANWNLVQIWGHCDDND